VADRSSLQVIDISNPMEPNRVGICSGTAVGVAVVEHYAFVAGDSTGLQVIDIRIRPNLVSLAGIIRQDMP